MEVQDPLTVVTLDGKFLIKRSQARSLFGLVDDYLEEYPETEIIDVDIPLYYLEKLLYFSTIQNSYSVNKISSDQWIALIHAAQYMQLSEEGSRRFKHNLKNYLFNFGVSIIDKSATWDDYIRRLSFLDNKELLKEDIQAEEKRRRDNLRKKISQQPIPEDTPTFITKSGRTL